MRLLLFALCPLLLANSAALSQNDTLASPYSFKWKRDLIASSAAAVLAVGGYFTSSRLKPLTESQVNSLDPYNLTGVDRAAINNWSPGSATASDVLLYSSFVLPGVMMLNKRMRKDYLVIGFIYAEVGMLTYGLTDLTKGLAKRVRPYAYNGDVDLEFRTTKGARQSFFSGHTAMTAALAFTTAKIGLDWSSSITNCHSFVTLCSWKTLSD
jgi:hypothetical protein